MFFSLKLIFIIIFTWWITYKSIFSICIIRWWTIKFTTKNRKKTISNKKSKRNFNWTRIKKYLSDHDLANQAVELAENDGIVFIDEIDKICGSRNSSYGGGERRVSQEGVQRDLLPLIEGTSVTVQNYGKINTDHILFICAGAFHDSKPSDLMPEFQGRLPVLIFTNDAINEIAQTAVLCNENVENIGARRLVTVIEKIMQDINVEASDIKKEGKNKTYTIDKQFVTDNIGHIGKGEEINLLIHLNILFCVFCVLFFIVGLIQLRFHKIMN